MNYDGDIIFEDNDDGSYSALTESVSQAMHGTPFSPVQFDPSAQDYGPERSQGRQAHRESQSGISNEDAMLLAQSRQSQSSRRVRIVGHHRQSLHDEDLRHENSRRSNSGMGYLPSRHFQQRAETNSSYMHQRPSTLQLNQDQQISTLSGWSEIPSPSNESQHTMSTMRSQRSHRSIASTRSRRSVVSRQSSTSLSILHGDVINLEGQEVYEINDAASYHNHPDDYDHSRQESALSGMEIGGGGDTSFNSHRRQSGHLSFVSSQGFSNLQERYQGSGSDPVFTFGHASDQIKSHATKLRKDAKMGVVKIKGHATSVAKQIMGKYYRPPLSPRSRELKDLEFLMQSHKEKFKHLKIANGNDVDDDESFLSKYNGDDDEDFFDFVIVLTPQESYEYWANLLDFREEYLGLDSADVWERELDGVSTRSTDSPDSGEDSDKRKGIFNRSPFSSDSDEQINEFSTPMTGLLRRKSMRRTPLSKTPSRGISRQVSRIFDSHQKSRFSQYSRSNLRSPFDGTPLRRGPSRLSMFERAVQSPSDMNNRRRTTSHHSYYSQSVQTSQSDTAKESSAVPETPATNHTRRPVSTVRRRFGNPVMPSASQKKIGNMFSPPVRSLKRETLSDEIEVPLNDSVRTNGVGKKLLRVDVGNGAGGEEENENPNIVRTVEDMPNPVIPRGFVGRRNPSKFLSALQGGIVLRRHRPNKEAIFCRLSSDNGGETIKYERIGSEEALAALKSQRIRYNRIDESTSPTSIRAACAAWSCKEGYTDNDSAHKFIPDHVASQKYREKLNRENGVLKRALDVAVNEAHSGDIDTKNIVALHPATKIDRRSPGYDKEELGTASLRRSLSTYDNDSSFSLIVTSAAQRFLKTPTDDLTDTWQQGEGSEHLFKTLDFEAATEGEYWLVLRGLLLLYRDALTKKQNSSGKTGIGGGEPNGFGGGKTANENLLQQDMFVEPTMVGCLEKLFVKYGKLDDDYIRGAVMPGAKPPPSDYFLGFKSPGTQIWSRLRWAGLETQRIFSADPRKVMIKIRCPEDRLTDLAEVLRLKMKTNEGFYAPFHEDAAHIFKSHDDYLDMPNMYRGGMASLLRSKDRQTIIDFIIGSRIRDSGAELTQMSSVGKMIEAKVPLHMPRKLDSLYNSWVLYWKREHWTGIEESGAAKKNESSMEEGSQPNDDDDSLSKDRRPVPNILTRFFVEAFNQPLNAIEEYFGEQVTFYFAWMQHCSIHLLVLAFLGMVVTFCQSIDSDDSEDGNHWLLPWWSLTVMLWTFFVLLNWRKRSNALAYQWGSLNYKEVETIRPEYFGNYTRDPITDDWVIKYPRWKRWLKYMISAPICIFFTGMSMFLILLVHANRDLMLAQYLAANGYGNNSTLGSENSTIPEFEFVFTWKNIGERQLVGNLPLTSDLLRQPKYFLIMFGFPCILGLCIPIMNVILMNLSVALNEFENYRTDDEFRTQLIVKVFGFRFISQFGTVYYYAFLAADIHTPASFRDGMIRMSTSLMIYTTVAHWWNIILHVYVFMGIRNIRHFFYQRRLRRELKKIELLEEEYSTNERCDAEVREIELINKRILLDQAQDEIWMEVMCPPHDSFPEYITSVIQFSFVACFSVVLPW